ncbi:ABC transporter substrate-binding protein [Ornithinimicrobium pekingense]|uniref:Glycine/betaine ABC transporter substrate-binding protein n=1 Tax=Ornithinimicrobium pekingense TaxID=384677 RepID=A0ABQ2F385_9MICO|nr:ABC transporter substrate-binding protein [Ornithinimicrobium pekingense]GGK56230.1 glycine/betaine ABC transporter substrate-binding protein [Ornithinimicrobium pekingense]
MRRMPAVLLALTATLALSACGGGDPLDADEGAGDTPSGGTTDDSGETEGGASSGDVGSVVVGSANFPENELLAEIYAAALSDQGVEVSTTLNIGSRETYMAGLEDGSIDLIPEYTGGLATFLNPEITATSSEEVLQEAQDNLPEGLQLLEISEAEDKDALVVTSETAEELGLTSIADLEGQAGDLVLGGPPEFETRPNGVAGLAEVYGVEFGQFRSLAAGSNLTVQALANGQVDAANIFTTDPAIEENDFVVLEDPESLFAAQNIVPLISSEVVNPTVEDALNAVSRALTTDNLTEMMVQVVSEGQDPAEVAREFVDANL